jgi:Tfp pilus assembly PilM family ATPase
LILSRLADRLHALGLGRKTGRFCAVDFDRDQVRVVQAEFSGERTRVLRLAAAAVPEDLDLTDAQAVGAFLGRTLGEMRIRNPAAVMNVSRGQAVLKPLVLPPVASAGELASMVLYQAEKELTFRPEEAVVDFTIESHYGIEPSGSDEPQGQHVLVAAVQRPLIEYYQKVAEAGGMRLLRLGLRPYADMRGVEAYAAPGAEARVAIIHVMAGETEIDIMDAGGLAFSRSAVVLVPREADGYAAVRREAAETIVKEVARSLQSYMGVERGQVIDVVLVAGGTGIESEVAGELAKRLSARCELLNPSEALGLEDSGPAASAFISPLGQAIRHGDPAALPFDFLHPKRPPVRRDMNKIAALSGVAAVALLVTGVFAGAAVHWYRADSYYSARVAELKQLTDENRRVAALAKRAETIDAWVRQGRDWLDQWAYLTNVFPSCTDVYITGLKTAVAGGPTPGGSISFTVKAKNNDAINELGKRLEAAGYAFKPGQVTTGMDPYGYVYSTSITVMVKPDMKVDLSGAAAAPRPEDDAAAEQFGKPRPAVAVAPTAVQPAPPTGPSASGIAPGTAPTGAATAGPAAGAPGMPATYKEYLTYFDQFLKTRPPEDGPLLEAWRAKRTELRQLGEALRKQEAGHNSEGTGQPWRRRRE